MVNLILDTDTWIYLSNGFNPETKKNEEELHFYLSDWILKNIKSGKLIGSRISGRFSAQYMWSNLNNPCRNL